MPCIMSYKVKALLLITYYINSSTLSYIKYRQYSTVINSHLMTIQRRTPTRKLKNAFSSLFTVQKDYICQLSNQKASESNVSEGFKKLAHRVKSNCRIGSEKGSLGLWDPIFFSLAQHRNSILYIQYNCLSCFNRQPFCSVHLMTCMVTQ